ncbi:MAG TPA: hypothetical protein VJY37_01645 [Anaerovoracaceae bacterium]|nr:hypothetical protein [Anaerovoracaceae bacterium]
MSEVTIKRLCMFGAGIVCAAVWRFYSAQMALALLVSFIFIQFTYGVIHDKDKTRK